MRRPGYREAILLIVSNEDCSDVLERRDDPIPSISMCLVADLFGVEVERVMGDVTRVAARLSSER